MLWFKLILGIASCSISENVFDRFVIFLSLDNDIETIDKKPHFSNIPFSINNINIFVAHK